MIDKVAGIRVTFDGLKLTYDGILVDAIQSNPIPSVQSNPIQSNPIQSNPIQSNPHAMLDSIRNGAVHTSCCASYLSRSSLMALNAKSCANKARSKRTCSSLVERHALGHVGQLRRHLNRELDRSILRATERLSDRGLGQRSKRSLESCTSTHEHTHTQYAGIRSLGARSLTI